MKLKATCDITEFLFAVRKCKGEVVFRSAQGDILNLKSQLSGFLFLSVAKGKDRSILECGEIQFDLEDASLLRDYMD